MTKDPVFKKVDFGRLQPWEKNPKIIKEDKLNFLAELMSSLGLFRNFTCWEKENAVGIYVTGGGSHRWLAAKHILKWPDSKKVMISINYPENEAEKLFLSMVDNMEFAQYQDEKLAEIAFKHRADLEILGFEKLDVNLGRRTPAERILKTFGPDGEKEDSQDPGSKNPSGEHEDAAGLEVACPQCGYIFNTKDQKQ